jgi:hypothetical protein
VTAKAESLGYSTIARRAFVNATTGQRQPPLRHRDGVVPLQRRNARANALVSA